MKRILSAMLAVVMGALLLSGCDNAKPSKGCEHNWGRIENLNEYTAVEKCSICGVTRMYTEVDDSILESGYEAGFKMLRYDWSGYGISKKEIYTCDLGYAIIDCLSKLQETGTVIPQISENALDDFKEQPPVTRGTVWIECGSVGLFRLNPEMTEICKVQTHLGEGRVLQMTDTLKELLRQAWYYYPNDYWSGSYEKGEFSLRQVYKADSAVESVMIESMQIENKYHSENNKIALSIRAKESKTVTVHLQSYRSGDNLGSFESKEVELIKDHETTVDFTFIGFDKYNYYVSIIIDNTRINLTIDPTNADQENPNLSNR